MHTYEIKESQIYGKVLFKDGQEVFCPFQAPSILEMGGTGLMRQPCCTNCALANLEEDKEMAYDINTNSTLVIQSAMRKVNYVTTCGCKESKFPVMIAVGNEIGI